MSDTIPPLFFHWDGDAMIPHRPKLADRYYVVGENYRLEVREERSTNSHNHYFACIHESWLNLPEHLAERFPTEDHLRKYALIKAGYRDERSIVCASKEEAERVAAFIKPLDEYAIVVPKDSVVTVYTAKSQSVKAMGKAEFQKSKTDVLDTISAMIGVRPETLRQEAGKAA